MFQILMKSDHDDHTEQNNTRIHLTTPQTGPPTIKLHNMQASSRWGLDLAAFYKFKYDMARTFSKVQILSKTDSIQGNRPLQAQRVAAREESVR